MLWPTSTNDGSRQSPEGDAELRTGLGEDAGRRHLLCHGGCLAKPWPSRADDDGDAVETC